MLNQETQTAEDPPFGSFALSPQRERVRAGIQNIPNGRVMRHAASLLRRLALAGWSGPVDFTPFPAVNVRLYPGENYTDKHLLMRPSEWDAPERAALLNWIRTSAAARQFNFFDVGANVGLYTLVVASEARTQGRKFQAVAIEPEPVNLGRLLFNLSASSISNDVKVVPAAVAATRGRLRMSVPQDNRGSSRISDDGDIEIDAVPLVDVVRDSRLSHIDAMKLDIEGHEIPVLERFFSDAEPVLFPELILTEAHAHERDRLLELCKSAGYAVAHRGFNSLLVKNAGDVVRLGLPKKDAM